MNKSLQKELKIKGLPLSPGLAIAKVCMFNERRHSNLPMYKVRGEGIELEIGRVERAIEIAGNKLDEIKKQVAERIGNAEAEIFVAQKMIMEDTTLIEKVADLIKNHCVNAENAVSSVLDSYETRLQEVDNEYLRDRASDFGEVKRRILDVLSDMKPSLQCTDEKHCQRGKNRIIVAEELTPSLTVDLETELVLGFISERGGQNSHGAILARALGIPAVSGLPDFRKKVGCGTELLINGDSGEVVIWPSEETITMARVEHEKPILMPAASDPVLGLKVMANISLATDVKEAIHMKAEGIGLYRTEMEIIISGKLLSQEELYQRYSNVVKEMKGLPVTFRTFDVGSDKPFPFLNISHEQNPSLGFRGARLLLGKKDLLQNQARALARASIHGPINIMYPMVIDLAQFLELKTIVEEAIKDTPKGTIKHGVMFEVPSACLDAREILEHADFGSIGTNDLIQYMFAIDRNNEFVAYDYNPGRPALWKMIKIVADAGAATGKSISVCGELAGDPTYLSKIMNLGIKVVSVSSRLIPGIRNELNKECNLMKGEK
ncbi:MAG: phosphoenolpyruvate--protein phosphotransferase [Lentisphaerae bacterium RIFOXYA12_FULL_48_11]|nr:MAG: phosphoenolpyruvate--protein phosphotransferase [Lentisphaerae bacterium RIFOXYA12_FULL_48_11]